MWHEAAVVTSYVVAMSEAKLSKRGVAINDSDISPAPPIIGGPLSYTIEGQLSTFVGASRPQRCHGGEPVALNVVWERGKGKRSDIGP